MYLPVNYIKVLNARLTENYIEKFSVCCGGENHSGMFSLTPAEEPWKLSASNVKVS